MKSSNNNTYTSIQINLSEISISPLNYRYGGQTVNEESLQELAASIAKHEVIQPVTVRPRPGGKYEIVVGERRYRASLLAGKTTIQAQVRDLTDEQVKEIQVIENLQREDPHPMAEAIGIHSLLNLKQKRNSVAGIAKRICKSDAYVYQRLKLVSLSEDLREMFFANKLNTTQALKLATLDAGSQAEFFEEHCSDWREEGFYFRRFNDLIEDFQLDLDNAPFDIKDAKLDKKAGACSNCQHNTAVATSLFPDVSNDARCTNRPCYKNKCRLFAVLNIAEVLNLYPGLPIAVPEDTVLTKYFGNDDRLINGREMLIEDIDFGYIEEMEERPKREDFKDYEDDDENEKEYQESLSEWETEEQRLNAEADAGNCRKAILISDRDFGKIVYLDPLEAASDDDDSDDDERRGSNYAPFKQDAKAKDYQQALKIKALTIPVIQGEKDRLNARETRSKELDEIKLQETFYAALKESEAVKLPETPSGANDRAVLAFLLYDSLGWSGKRIFDEMIINAGKSDDDDFMNDTDEQLLIHFFFHATENQLSFLVRLSMLNKTDAKAPNGLCGQMLRILVEQTPGLDAAEIINIQRTVTKEREVKLAQKIAVLDKQAEQLPDEMPGDAA